MLVSVAALKPNPLQPRSSAKDWNVTSLAESIRRSGLLQPIVVRRATDGFEIIAGERRWRAAQSLGMTEIPVIAREADDEQLLEFAMIENLQREDLSPIDRALGYRQLCARFGLRPDDVAERLGEDRTTVVNYLRLLELPTAVRTLVAEGKLGAGHARCLVTVADDHRKLSLAESVVRNELSVRALEEIVRRQKSRDADPTTSKPPPRAGSPHVRAIEQRFEAAVRTRVRIQEGKRKGSGRIVIEYYSLDDFDRIASMLGVAGE